MLFLVDEAQQKNIVDWVQICRSTFRLPIWSFFSTTTKSWRESKQSENLACFCFICWLLMRNNRYGAGRMLTGEVKEILIRVLIDFVARHQRAREAVTDDMIDAFFAVRDMKQK
jgi:hypothetical protein